MRIWRRPSRQTRRKLIAVKVHKKIKWFPFECLNAWMKHTNDLKPSQIGTDKSTEVITCIYSNINSLTHRKFWLSIFFFLLSINQFCFIQWNLIQWIWKSSTLGKMPSDQCFDLLSMEITIFCVQSFLFFLFFWIYRSNGVFVWMDTFGNWNWLREWRVNAKNKSNEKRVYSSFLGINNYYEWMQFCVAFLHNKLMNLCTLICSLQAITAQSEWGEQWKEVRWRIAYWTVGHRLFLSAMCPIYNL